MGYSSPDLRESVYRYLRQSIITGDLRAGTRLVEDQISAELNVSRTPVREAIQRLTTNGLVTRVRRGQVEVRYVSQEERDQLHLLRLAFDGVVSKLITERVELVDWDYLYSLVDPIAIAQKSGDLKSSQMAIAHLNLHLAINNEAFNHSVAPALMSQSLLYIIDPAVQPPDYDPAESHGQLLDQLRSGDEGKAFEALHAHAVLKVAH